MFDLSIMAPTNTTKLDPTKFAWRYLPDRSEGRIPDEYQDFLVTACRVGSVSVEYEQGSELLTIFYPNLTSKDISSGRLVILALRSGYGDLDIRFDPISAVSSTAALSQAFIKLLFTTPATDVLFDDSEGFNLSSALSSISLDDEPALTVVINTGLQKVAQAIMTYQFSSDYTIPPQDYLVGAELVSISVDKHKAEINIQVRLTTKAGTKTFNFGVSQ